MRFLNLFTQLMQSRSDPAKLLFIQLMPMEVWGQLIDIAPLESQRRFDLLRPRGDLQGNLEDEFVGHQAHHALLSQLLPARCFGRF
ncbi:MAG: hypothetical protein ACR2RE_29830 [Geminicoccaceae bacterium]